jgi:hypothetical protein
MYFLWVVVVMLGDFQCRVQVVVQIDVDFRLGAVQSRTLDAVDVLARWEVDVRSWCAAACH